MVERGAEEEEEEEEEEDDDEDDDDEEGGLASPGREGEGSLSKKWRGEIGKREGSVTGSSLPEGFWKK